MVLFVCPILLILIAGAVLNSNDFKNVRIGIIDLDVNFDFDIGGVAKPQYYKTLQECISDLNAARVTVCMFVGNEDGTRDIQIYIDNTVRMVQLYAKQFVLESVLKKQSSMLEETSADIDSKLTLYSTSIDAAKEDLSDVSSELEYQEVLLKEYKTNLSSIKRDVDSIYISLKDAEPEMIQLRNNLVSINNNLDYDIAEIRANIQQVNNAVYSLRNDLSSMLTAEEYSQISPYLNNLSSSTSQLDLLLKDLEEMDNNLPTVINLLYQLEDMIKKIEGMKMMLDKLDSDLNLFIKNNQDSQVRINSFINQLNNVQGEMHQFSGDISGTNSNVVFFDAYQIDDTPSFLVFPLLVSIIITFTSLILSNMFTLKEINEPSYFRDMITPIWDITFIMSNYLINLFFISIQAVVLFILGVRIIGISSGSIFVFAFSVFLTSSIFIFLGMSLGYLIRNQNMSMLVSIFFLILLLILSDLFAPSVLAGQIVRFFTDLNPFVILASILSDVMIFGKSSISVIPGFVKLFIFLFGAMLLCYISRKIRREEMVI